MDPIKIPRASASADIETILQLLNEVGGVIIEGLLRPDQVQRFNAELEKPMNSLQAGSTHEEEFIQDFHGAQTKRLTNVCTHSKVFRDEVLDNDLVHQIAAKIFHHESGTYWMNAAQVIEIGPGNKAQALHRDNSSYTAFNAIGRDAPEVVINFLVALTTFTDINGGTRVIPGSHRWSDFSVQPSPEDTIACEMNPGDALFINGKILHGGGANRTSNEKRRAISFSLQASFLTPEEAYPFQVSLDIVKTMNARAQRMIGFRSQFPKGSPGLWQTDCGELGDMLDLKGADPQLREYMSAASLT
ncbi:uncharacterized protein N7498_005980 [Penicillium cinerascens]|uniref:Uncharacterized protein n=1 Tax=Penicillium cinerascens TaxID=70096 RepID=A0A9W9T0V7_9EURO|nr:uncharacterized protein N7498_005980 [Penicillium cinerascens]KAJ5205101.1 hypothetical protein N7498_005980 [Penicillium cinerascens]